MYIKTFLNVGIQNDAFLVSLVTHMVRMDSEHPLVPYVWLIYLYYTDLWHIEPTLSGNSWKIISETLHGFAILKWK